MQLYEKALELLQEGKTIALAEIIQHSGSTPREKGARMLVLPDGSVLDTIGGGRMEQEAAAAALRLLAAGQGGVYTFEMNAKDVTSSDMICGGRGKVLIAPLTREDVPALEAACQAIASRAENAWLVTLLEGGKVYHVFLDQKTGKLVGPPLSSKQERRVFDSTGVSMHSQEEAGVVLCPRPLTPPERLLIFGAGHVGVETARLCGRIGFDVSIVDDREEFLEPRRIFGAKPFLAATPRELPENFCTGEDTWVLIVTRGHLLDRQWLKWALEVKPGPIYVGMIGSRRKRELIYGQLLNEGIPQEQLQAVYSPVGLAIGAETPAEIAVCIAAQLIQLRSGRREKGQGDGCPA